MLIRYFLIPIVRILSCCINLLYFECFSAFYGFKIFSVFVVIVPNRLVLNVGLRLVSTTGRLKRESTQTVDPPPEDVSVPSIGNRCQIDTTTKIS